MVKPKHNKPLKYEGKENLIFIDLPEFQIPITYRVAEGLQRLVSDLLGKWVRLPDIQELEELNWKGLYRVVGEKGKYWTRTRQVNTESHSGYTHYLFDVESNKKIEMSDFDYSHYTANLIYIIGREQGREKVINLDKLMKKLGY